MSNGNAGPGLGTGDHPSADYINVAASSTTGTYASGRFNVTAPEPVPANLQGHGLLRGRLRHSDPVGRGLGAVQLLPAAVANPANARAATLGRRAPSRARPR